MRDSVVICRAMVVTVEIAVSMHNKFNDGRYCPKTIDSSGDDGPVLLSVKPALDTAVGAVLKYYITIDRVFVLQQLLMVKSWRQVKEWTISFDGRLQLWSECCKGGKEGCRNGIPVG